MRGSTVSSAPVAVSYVLIDESRLCEGFTNLSSDSEFSFLRLIVRPKVKRSSVTGSSSGEGGVLGVPNTGKICEEYRETVTATDWGLSFTDASRSFALS